MKILHHKKLNLQSIHNIIFDWGGVITNIDYHIAVQSFENLGIKNFDELFSQNQQSSLFKKFEIGKISNDELRFELKKLANTGVTDKEIDSAWCSMLLDTPKENLELLADLSKKYNIYLLSNTNNIHVPYYNAYLKNKMGVDYPSLFKKSYYSHQIGMRKPNADVYKFVLADSNLQPHETLFIDDTEINIDTAANLGIQSLYLQSGVQITNVF